MDGTDDNQLFNSDTGEESDPFEDIHVEEPTVTTGSPIQLDTDDETNSDTHIDYIDSVDEYDTGDPCSPAH